MELSDAKFEQLLSVIEHIHGCDSLDAFPKLVLQELGGVIEHNLCGFNEVNVPLKRAVVTFYPDDDSYEWMVKPFEKNLLQHPVMQFYEESGEGQAMAISDFLSEDEFHALPIYEKMFEQVQAEDQIAIGLKLDDGILLSIAFNRSHRGFSEEEREILNLLRPHIARAYLNLAKLEAAKTKAAFLEVALDESGLGVIEFDATGAVVGASAERVLDDLRPFFRSEGEGIIALPEKLRELIVGFALTESKSEKHQLEAGEERLSVNLRKRGAGVLLIASKGVMANKTARLYGLTHRETEIGRLLGEGKSNEEISEILQTTPKAVNSHVQSILVKLGAENRTKAAEVLKRGLSSDDRGR